MNCRKQRCVTEKEKEELFYSKLPYPVKVCVNCDNDIIQMHLNIGFAKMKTLYNQKYPDFEDIPFIITMYNKNLDKNDFEVYVGQKKILSGLLNYENLDSFFYIIERSLECFHNDILEQIVLNDKLITSYENIGNYYFPFKYYSSIYGTNNRKTFHFLKKLYVQNPEKYKNLMRRYYRRSKNYKMYRKLTDSKRKTWHNP